MIVIPRCARESITADARHAVGDGHGGQAAATRESRTADARYAVGNGHGGQAAATRESKTADARHALGDGYGGQAATTRESGLADARHALENGHGGQATATRESGLAYRCDSPSNNVFFYLFPENSSIVNIKNSITNYGSNNLLELAKSTVVINASNQTLNGKVLIDDSSTLQMNLSDKTTYTGSIPNTKSNISIKLSKDSKINLSGDIYVASLENEDLSNNNIITNGHHIYVNNNQIK